MGLAAGTRLSHDEIIALLGSGGVGEVYRARDGMKPGYGFVEPA